MNRARLWWESKTAIKPSGWSSLCLPLGTLSLLIARQSRVQRALVDKQARLEERTIKSTLGKEGTDVRTRRLEREGQIRMKEESIAKRRVEVGYWLTPEKKFSCYAIRGVYDLRALHQVHIHTRKNRFFLRRDLNFLIKRNWFANRAKHSSATSCSPFSNLNIAQVFRSSSANWNQSDFEVKWLNGFIDRDFRRQTFLSLADAGDGPGIENEDLRGKPRLAVT